MNYLDTTTLTSPVARSPPPSVAREPRQNMGYVIAKFDFQAQDDEDLPFKRGDVLEIIRKQEDKENGRKFFSDLQLFVSNFMTRNSGGLLEIHSEKKAQYPFLTLKVHNAVQKSLKFKNYFFSTEPPAPRSCKI